MILLVSATPGEYQLLDAHSRERLYGPFQSNPDRQLVADAIASQRRCEVVIEDDPLPPFATRR